ncbi:MAG TPA: DUF4349 domain-containing protein [Stellaceae bacterium]|nr:DUF4349 domain-containing protein [Stellaceae bacterium]
MIEAQYNSPKHNPWGTQPGSAKLRVRLAHDSVEPFAAAIIAPLPDERPGDIILTGRSDTAEDLTGAITDVDQHLAQLTDYRDRLNALLKRGDAKVEDLIKLEEAISTTQSRIEELTATQKGLNRRVDTEEMTVTFAARASLTEQISPIRRAWERAGDTLAASTAAAIEFAIVLLPWLFLASIVFALGRFAYRLLKRKRA